MLASVQPPAPGRRPILIDDAFSARPSRRYTPWRVAARFPTINRVAPSISSKTSCSNGLPRAKSKPTKNFAKKPNALYIKAHGVKGSVNVRKPDEDSFRVGKPVKTGKSASGIHFIADTRGCETGVFAKNHSRKLSFTPQKQNGIWLT